MNQQERERFDALMSARSDTHRVVRLFNRLDAAISHHKKAHEARELFVDDPDAALWKARDQILSDYHAGEG